MATCCCASPKQGAAIEDALGSAQDVEGCVEAAGSRFVVQMRPQMCSHAQQQGPHRLCVLHGGEAPIVVMHTRM